MIFLDTSFLYPLFNVEDDDHPVPTSEHRLAGRVAEDGFSVQVIRKSYDRGGYLPRGAGRLTSRPDGTDLEIVLSVSPLNWGVLLLALGLMETMTAAHDGPWALPVVVIAVAHLVGVLGGFWPEAKRVERLLLQTLEAQRR